MSQNCENFSVGTVSQGNDINEMLVDNAPGNVEGKDRGKRDRGRSTAPIEEADER